jgi:hypothetical protein
MRRLILLCTILAFSATMVVNAQSITTSQIQTKKEQQTLTPADKAKLARTQKEDPVKEIQTPQDVQQEEVQPAVNSDGTQPVERLGEHGPYLNDPQLDVKVDEWKKNYPEEYKNSQQQKTKTNPTK